MNNISLRRESPTDESNNAKRFKPSMLDSVTELMTELDLAVPMAEQQDFAAHNITNESSAEQNIKNSNTSQEATYNDTNCNETEYELIDDGNVVVTEVENPIMNINNEETDIDSNETRHELIGDGNVVVTEVENPIMNINNEETDIDSNETGHELIGDGNVVVTEVENPIMNINNEETDIEEFQFESQYQHEYEVINESDVDSMDEINMAEVEIHYSDMINQYETRNTISESFLHFIRNEHGHNDIEKMYHFLFYYREVDSIQTNTHHAASTEQSSSDNEQQLIVGESSTFVLVPPKPPLGNIQLGPFSFSVKTTNPITLKLSALIEDDTQFELDLFVFQMQVKFSHGGTEKILRRVIKTFFEENCRYVKFNFDGRSNIFTSIRLIENTNFVKIFDEETNSVMEFTIVTKFVNKIKMCEILDISNTSKPRNVYSDEVIKELFNVMKTHNIEFPDKTKQLLHILPRNPVFDENSWISLIQYYTMKKILDTNSVGSRVELVHESLVKYISNTLHCDLSLKLDKTNFDKLSNFTNRLKITYMIPDQPHTYRECTLLGIINCPAHTYMVKDDTLISGSGTINLVEYYQQIFNYTITYSHLPCAKAVNAENKHTLILPIELCTVRQGQLRFTNFPDHLMLLSLLAAGLPINQELNLENYSRAIKNRQINCLLKKDKK